MFRRFVVVVGALTLASCGANPPVTLADDAGAGDACTAKKSCKSEGAECGTIDDGCGGKLGCGDTCVFPNQCGGGGVDNKCGCTQETDKAFCKRLGKNCDQVSDFDNCEKSRSVGCGSCSTPDSCGGGGHANVCGHPGDKCQSVTCNAGETCDTADGLCKCTATSCPNPKVCSTGKRCLDATDPCNTKVCDPTVPSCVDVGGVATCQCTATSCPAYDACDATSHTCLPTNKCQGVTCADGEACDAADGVCKCTGTSCPSPKVCSTGKRCVDPTDPCVTKVCDPTTPVCVNQGGVAVCQCTTSSCPSGQLCSAGSCVPLGKCQGVSCVTGETCDPVDGACKCSATSCPDTQCCVSQKCVQGADPCVAADCGGTTPVCVNVHCTAVCECNATSCPSGKICSAGTCVDGKCGAITCTQGETCDPADGVCKCSTGSCPAGKTCSAKLHCVTAEICNNGIDDDGNGLTDCKDPACASDPACAGKVETNCTDKVDNDGDGLTDCADPDCAKDPTCAGKLETNCADKVDNDGDGLTDCADPDCDGQSCGVGCVCKKGFATETICDDGIDNDGDGYTDCKDIACVKDPACAGQVEQNCTDGIDNDGDGYTDCNDSDCASDPACVVDCSKAPRCSDLSQCCLMSVPDNCGAGCTCGFGVSFTLCVAKETDCGDGIDNDGDGKTDCFDDDCIGSPSCETICDDGIDNDGDGKTDCDDKDCAYVPPCCGGFGASCGLGQKECCSGLKCDNSIFGTCQ